MPHAAQANAGCPSSPGSAQTKRSYPCVGGLTLAAESKVDIAAPTSELCWQGLFISFLVGGGVIDSVRDGKNLQNFLICIEMLGASFGMVIAFPYTEYKTAGGPPCPQP